MVLLSYNGYVYSIKIDFSLASPQMRVAKIKVIRFSVIPKITASIVHEDCANLGSASITTSIKGGVPPFTYNWTGPSTSSTATKIGNITPGIYTLEVTDSWSTPHVVTKVYEIGYAITTTNLSGCRHDNYSDQKRTDLSSVSRSEMCVKSTSSGTAESVNQLNPNKDGGVSYQVDQIGYTKTFGLSDKENNHSGELINYSIQLANNGLENMLLLYLKRCWDRLEVNLTLFRFLESRLL